MCVAQLKARKLGKAVYAFCGYVVPNKVGDGGIKFFKE
jgi:hypothetical protein